MDFTVLPDHPEAENLITGNSAFAGARSIPHHSGRPWLVGRWADRDVLLVTEGPYRIAVFGHLPKNTQGLARALERATSPYGLDALARSVPGSVHLVASLDGDVRAQGSLSTARHIFTARTRGVSVAASSPALLAALTGAGADESALALQLLDPLPPWPLTQRSVWTGVEALTPGHWLHLRADGSGRQIRWWHPPPDDLPLADAAAAVRDALTEAVALRTGRPGRVSADLSGGLDSTCLCFIAEARTDELSTYHVAPLDEANEDTLWARRAADRLPRARHHWIPKSREANWFDVETDPGRALDTGEGPALWSSGAAHLTDLSRAAAEDGSSLHMMGLGGDELFGSTPSYLWSLARRHPLRSLPVIQRHRLLNRWPLAATVRALADRGDFPHALMASARRLTAPPPRPPHLDLGWTGGSRMPPWATPAAVALVRELYREAAEAGTAPLDPDRLRHQLLEFTGYDGRLIRQTRRAMAASGVEWDAPMLDDRVVEAAMSVRLSDRMVRGRFKPLLTAAMRGTVPADILDRRSKGEFSAELHEGVRRNRDRFLDLCTDLRLAERGLVNADALRTAFLAPSPESHHLSQFENTVACEAWLRSPSAAPHPVGEPR